jgi:hypothetical protein
MIYILSSGNHVTTRTINLSGCVAIVGSGNVTLYSTVQLPNGMLDSTTTARSHIIVENIKIDGTNDAAGTPHTANARAIYLRTNGAYNATITSCEVYGNANQ